MVLYYVTKEMYMNGFEIECENVTENLKENQPLIDIKTTCRCYHQCHVQFHSIEEKNNHLHKPSSKKLRIINLNEHAVLVYYLGQAVQSPAEQQPPNTQPTKIKKGL